MQPLKPMDSKFMTHLVSEVDPQSDDQKWLLEGLWLVSGVGILCGHPKTTKTWFAAELSVAVAAGIPAFNHFPSKLQGSVLFYAAEDSLSAMRTRFEGIALARNLSLKELPIHLIDVPVLQLDKKEDALKLRGCIDALRPTLLVLDPFVRITSIDENSSSEVSAVLGFLRGLQRDYNIAILLIHHAKKSATAHPNQALRGSGDFAAWSDTNLYLSRQRDILTLNIQHRSAKAPDPINFQLKDNPAPHLEVQNSTPAIVKAPESLSDEIMVHLANKNLTTVELRDRLRKRKTDVVLALEQLRTDKKINRNQHGWFPLLQPNGST
jgi:hypothetical protein